jgi:putative membrane protein
MQIVRTIVWVLLLFALLVFSFFNWKPVEVTIWDNLVLETKVPALVVVSFLLGLVPMWLLHRGTLWRHRRRIGALEANQRATVNAITAPAAPPPMASDGPLAPEAAAVVPPRDDPRV